MWKIRIENYLSALLILTSVVTVSGQTDNKLVTIKVNMNKEAQTINGFGASDAWSCQFIGKNWPIEKREKIADWLFSPDTLQNGQPKGIGLSIWRFNIGGGTTEQGDSSNIGDEWRRAECFLNVNGSYDWQKQAGQQWFLNAAIKRGVNNIVAFSNTPPVFFTKNGKGWSTGGSSVNLKPEKYTAYADFLVNVLQHFNSKGIILNVLSPFNEPQWNWDGKGQEGTPCRNIEMYNVVKLISAKLSTLNIKTQIEVPDAGQINYLFQDNTKLDDRDNQIYDFFSPASPLYIGALPNVSQSIAGHSYFSTYNVENMKNMRTQLHSKLTTINKELIYNMTEYCVLEDNKEIVGGGRDLGINSAIYIAKVIHYDLTLANASSWQWWTAISPCDYKDGLVYTDLNKIDGNIYDSKMLWALGQYSRFVKAGMRRVDVDVQGNSVLNDGNEALLVSTFKASNNNKLVAVVVNQSVEDRFINIEVDNTIFKTIKTYRTTAKSDENITPSGYYKLSDKIIIPGRAIVTLELSK